MRPQETLPVWFENGSGNKMAEEEKWRSSHWQVESELAKFRWK